MAKASCKKYDLSGKETGQVEIEFGDEPSVNSQLIKDYIVALRANSRQWSANTKGRHESNHSGAKPHPQKGTGRARQGFLGAPQFKGGGRVHSPKPKFDQHVRINRKERQAAIRALLVQKLKNNELVVLDGNMDAHFEQPKTKAVSQLLKGIDADGKRVVYLFADEVPTPALWNFRLSMRNIPKIGSMLLQNINGYDVLVNKKLVVMASAVEELERILRG
ncbi:MAG: 50S ribosomal protein L4 [Chlamydiae bacterium]|jgi:large subunit ribosomal protein L4|nr:50S ribosomal protein L4 [Chlamydiota bacterium]